MRIDQSRADLARRMTSRLTRLIGMAACAAILAACSSLRTDFVKQPSTALPPATDTPSARYLAGEVSRRAGESGFRLLTKSNNALMSRVALADHALHSLDLQYYIFKNDAP